MTSVAAEPARPVRLSDLVDGIAERSCSWVVVELFGRVVCHGAGAGQCPEALARTLLSKDTSWLRLAVVWERRSGVMRGAVGTVAVHAAELGEGGTVWFVGGSFDAAAVPLVSAALHSSDTPVHDPVVEDLLRPRRVLRAGAAPAARLLVLQSGGPVSALARAASRALAGSSARVHVVEDVVLVALPPHVPATSVLQAVRKLCSDTVGGTAITPEGAADWGSTSQLAAAAGAAARSLGLSLGDPDNPAVAAVLIVQQASEAVAELERQLPSGPLQRLLEHDRRNSAELVATVTAWCRAGFDVADASAALHVHPNTLRYRLRRAGEISGFDLTRPRERLAAQLLLQV